ncbi:P-loop containing nucleoside triphosphate hydrolase protein [Hypoxylon trugodes]|uniref:P-loop containing nucleoside triphosphate hydrolase protein n=1 Tax=Hypoxylon trugodes TaxID=326681 RepID=UPI00218FF4C4|nr:P-loop containing nucleoside triphosphate hydrolase protein [Hypoxylon trugodes]KAI1387952.1 P-loop containing nucleoside triphosphate hydrolase protein [Hypoxylon trugodes]
MATSTETSLLTALEARLLDLEKQHAELNHKYSSVLESMNQGEKGIIGRSDGPKKPLNISSDGMRVKDENEEVSIDSRVKIIKTIKDPETGERVERKDETPNAKPEDNRGFAFVLRKIVHDKFSGEEDVSEIDIVNLGLWKLLREHLGEYPGHTFRGSPVTLYSPYEALIFKWDILEQEAAKDLGPEGPQEKQAREDLRTLLDILSGGSSGDAKLDKYFKIREGCRRDKTVQFDDLWTIFPPGTLIYGKPFQGQDQVFVVQENRGSWPDRGDRPQQLLPWQLVCWSYDWNGERLQRTGFTLLFEPFDGHKLMASLPYYPLDLHADHGDVKLALIERGKKFRDFCTAKEGSRLFEYTGKTIFGKKGFSGLVQPDEDDNDSRSLDPYLGLERRMLRRYRSMQDPTQAEANKSSYISGRVVVDYLSYVQYGPPIIRNGSLNPSLDDLGCMCSDCQQNEGLTAMYRTHFDTAEAQMQKTLEDEQYMLCPPRLLGYVLGEKQWAQLQVTLMKDIPVEDPGNPWKNRLQVADETKNMLFNLIQSHVSTMKTETTPEETGLEVNDIIPGKGKGLVILLYGPPGVGKTSTAETIAIATRKPLFSISVADVGTRARHVESNLSKIFALAASWQAILLIDEADVFLESRGRGNSTSTDRNALVSVFLRVLEYYQGIMFLTTNQIAQFDVAIPSRIHIAIPYETLVPAQMEKIFRGFLEPLVNNNLVDNFDGIMEYLKEHVYYLKFDGRQIRNIVTTALGLARAESQKGRGKLTQKHLRDVVTNVRKFQADFAVQYDRYITSQEKLIR